MICPLSEPHTTINTCIILRVILSWEGMSTDFLFDETAPANEDEEALFLDRLELFLERSLDEFRHFAEREGRDFLQVRQRV